ncbi:GRB2-associated and regulator of MAPK protein 1-like isoform X2 [Salvelinus fontinalis]|uniref:GRB2-associated and regulator of MAPK protein 1-like isoform X2 n=1 Tax=Salvelinus fontinalis TaxID=8038 RepID=UPI0024857393|nr:GRB2-associated and regulator of MAPK protein 1-like isoform X2 [Salvelinus fontinalis]
MHVVCLQANMDLGSMLYNNLKDVSWSTTSLPLDRLVSVYRLPQIVKLDSGELVDVLRDNDYLLIHSCRQWTTITAHSLEEGHYVIGPKIEIPVHYEGQFKLLEQDRDVKEPVQYFNSVEEVAKAFPERVYVMEEITFNVKMASGECNEDTEVYNITLSTGDELTLMGQAEILYAKASKEKSRFNTIFKKIGKLNSISKIANRGKMPCLICMNHRTNESVSLPFQCKGRFSTCSPLELQMLEGEHTIRNIVENTRLPVNVSVPGSPPRNQHDVHLIRESHRYKLVNIQTKTVVVGCVLRSNKIIPVHFPLHMASMPKFIIPEGLLQNELWLDTMVHRWFTYCQEQFDIDDYSRAVRDVRTDWNDVDGRSPKKSSGSGGSSNGCSSHMHMPSSLTYARDELTQSFHRLSVCVYGNNLHSNSEVNLQGCMTLCGDWVLLPSEGVPADSVDTEYLFPELLEDMSQSDVPYEELWLDHLRSSRGGGGHSVGGEDPRGTSNTIATSMAVISYPVSSEICLAPPPVPPKSEAVKVECRHLNAPPIPPRSSKQMMSTPTPAVAKARQTETRSPSPTLSYYSSGLHSIGGENEVTEADEQNHVCYPCNWVKGNEECLTASHVSPPLDGVLSCPSRLSWPNDFYGGDSQSMEEFLPIPCQSYYSYPRKRPSGTPKSPCTSSLFDLDRKEQKGGSAIPLKSHKASYTNHFCTKSSSYTLEMYRDNIRDECNTKQSLSCPILPPRMPKSNETCKDSVEDTAQDTLKCLVSQQHDQVTTTEIFSISYPPLPPLSSPSLPAPGGQWQPPTNLSGLSIEEVSKSLRFIGISGDIVSSFVTEKIDGNLLLQLTEEILTEDFKLSKLQVKKLMQFIKGWRPII